MWTTKVYLLLSKPATRTMCSISPRFFFEIGSSVCRSSSVLRKDISDVVQTLVLSSRDGYKNKYMANKGNNWIVRYQFSIESSGIKMLWMDWFLFGGKCRNQHFIASKRKCDCIWFRIWLWQFDVVVSERCPSSRQRIFEFTGSEHTPARPISAVWCECKLKRSDNSYTYYQNFFGSFYFSLSWNRLNYSEIHYSC